MFVSFFIRGLNRKFIVITFVPIILSYTINRNAFYIQISCGRKKALLTMVPPLIATVVPFGSRIRIRAGCCRSEI